MNGAILQRGREGSIDRTVLLQERHVVKRGIDNENVEVIARARTVGDLDRVGSGERSLQLLC